MTMPTRQAIKRASIRTALTTAIRLSRLPAPSSAEVVQEMDQAAVEASARPEPTEGGSQVASRGPDYLFTVQNGLLRKVDTPCTLSFGGARCPDKQRHMVVRPFMRRAHQPARSRNVHRQDVRGQARRGHRRPSSRQRSAHLQAAGVQADSQAGACVARTRAREKWRIAACHSPQEVAHRCVSRAFTLVAT